MINTGLITTIRDENIKSFINLSVESFFTELNYFIKQNQDPTVLGYVTERTLLSLMISGLYRHSDSITAIQEYKLSENEKNGRADAFIKWGNLAILVESKFQDIKALDQEMHWDIQSWLIWDEYECGTQLNRYYRSEDFSKKNGTYSRVYLLSIVFKLIGEDPKKHAESANQKLRRDNRPSDEREWYYHFRETEKFYEIKGVEIYGTLYPTDFPSSEK